MVVLPDSKTVLWLFYITVKLLLVACPKHTLLQSFYLTVKLFYGHFT